MINFFFDLVKKRRSIRRFSDQQIEQEKIDMLMKTALLAPTSKNSTPWHFILVEDQEMLQKLSESRLHGSQFVNRATLAIIVACDTTISEAWVEDAAIVSTYIQLQAENMGLGSCWMQVRERMKDDEQTTENYIRGLLNVPENICILNMIALGYKIEDKTPEKEEQLIMDRIQKKMLLQERIHKETF